MSNYKEKSEKEEYNFDYLAEIADWLESRPFLQSDKLDVLEEKISKAKMALTADGASNLKDEALVGLDATLEAAHVFLCHDKRGKFKSLMEIASKGLILLSNENLPYRHIYVKYSLLKVLNDKLSRKARLAQYKELLTKANAGGCDQLSIVLHLLVSLLDACEEKQVSYNVSKSCISFFFNRLQLPQKQPANFEYLDMIFLTKKLHVEDKHQKDIVALSAAVSFHLESLLRLNFKEINVQTETIAKKSSFFVSCLPSKLQILLKPHTDKTLSMIQKLLISHPLPTPEEGPRNSKYKLTFNQEREHHNKSRARESPQKNLPTNVPSKVVIGEKSIYVNPSDSVFKKDAGSMLISNNQSLDVHQGVLSKVSKKELNDPKFLTLTHRPLKHHQILIANQDAENHQKQEEYRRNMRGLESPLKEGDSIVGVGGQGLIIAGEQKATSIEKKRLNSLLKRKHEAELQKKHIKHTYKGSHWNVRTIRTSHSSSEKPKSDRPSAQPGGKNTHLQDSMNITMNKDERQALKEVIGYPNDDTTQIFTGGINKRKRIGERRLTLSQKNNYLFPVEKRVSVNQSINVNNPSTGFHFKPYNLDKQSSLKSLREFNKVRENSATEKLYNGQRMEEVNPDISDDHLLSEKQNLTAQHYHRNESMIDTGKNTSSTRISSRFFFTNIIRKDPSFILVSRPNYSESNTLRTALNPKDANNETQNNTAIEGLATPQVVQNGTPLMSPNFVEFDKKKVPADFVTKENPLGVDKAGSAINKLRDKVRLISSKKKSFSPLGMGRSHRVQQQPQISAIMSPEMPNLGTPTPSDVPLVNNTMLARRSSYNFRRLIQPPSGPMTVDDADEEMGEIKKIDIAFEDNDLEELKDIFTVIEKRTVDDLCTRTNPAKTKRLLKKALEFISLNKDMADKFPPTAIQERPSFKGGRSPALGGERQSIDFLAQRSVGAVESSKTSKDTKEKPNLDASISRSKKQAAKDLDTSIGNIHEASMSKNLKHRSRFGNADNSRKKSVTDVLQEEENSGKDDSNAEVNYD
jgi:hypothetical protein